MLKITVTRQHLIEVVTGIRHTMLKLMHLVFNLLKMTEGSQCGFVNRRSLFEMNVLCEQAKLEAAHAHDFATIGTFFSVHLTEDRRLAGAITTDQTDMLARIDL